MKLREILTGVPSLRAADFSETEIRGLSYSSGSTGPGDLFAALKGEKTDGNLFVSQAVERGAAAILSEQEAPAGFDRAWVQVRNSREALALCAANFYGHPSLRLKVTGITGTKGKTTTSYILDSILRKAGYSTGLIGTISYRGPGMETAAARTTPEAPDLQAWMMGLVDAGASHCVMEVSSHALALHRVTGVAFDAALFTNLSGEHMEFHQTMDRYFEAKKSLFTAGPKSTMAVINRDDEWGQKLMSRISMGTVTYGLNPESSVCGESYRLTESGLEIAVRYPTGRLTLSSPLLGRPNVSNILAAAAAALVLNIPAPKIVEGVASLKGVPGRFERIENSRGLKILVDYAHTDSALKSLLETARELNAPRIILVFGAGGDRDRFKRARMGEVAGSLADLTIVTSDNPRSEEPMAIIAEIEKGLKKSEQPRYEIVPDRRQAIRRALEEGKPGDYILVAGKGHESTQTIGREPLPFDDREVIRDILRGMGRD